MLTIKELSFRNFMSYGNNVSTVRFDQNKATLIVGEDLDNTSAGRTSNGTGKTSIINALLYCLYDKVLDPDIPVDGLINNVNGKDLEVTCVFERHNVTYVVKRYRKTKAGTGVYFEEDGQDVTAGNNTNEKIAKAIGIPFELFVRIIVFPAGREPFLKLPSRSTTRKDNQSAIIEELFGYNIITQKAKQLKDVYIKEAEDLVNAEVQRKNIRDREISTHHQQLATAKAKSSEWDVVTARDIATIKQQLLQIETVDIEQQQSVQQMYLEVKERVRQAESTIRQLEGFISRSESTLKSTLNEISALQRAECPYCHQHFADQAKLDAALTQQGTITDQLTTSRSELAILQEEKVLAGEDAAALKLAIEANNVEQMLKLVSQRASMEARLQTLERAVNPFLSLIDEYTQSEPQPFDSTLLDQQAEILKHRKFLYALLTKKDSFIRKALLDRNLPYLNSRLAHYLAKMGLPHKVEFTPEMTVKITRYGKEIHIGNLSAGQKARCDFALSVSFRDALQQQYGAVNVCLMDEVFDVGLDSMGVFAAADIVREIAAEENLNIFVVSHREEIEAMFSHQLRVTFKDGFSTLLQPV